MNAAIPAALVLPLSGRTERSVFPSSPLDRKQGRNSHESFASSALCSKHRLSFEKIKSMPTRQLHLGAFMRPVSLHTAAWRYPGAYPDANFNFRHLKTFAETLERAKFDAFFMADHLAVLNMPIEALRRSHTVTSFEPFTLLSALATATSRIGLVATASTTFDEPYHIARRFASLDHISEGRAGWNIVTTSNPDAALNFGLEDHVDHAERYRRAREFYDVVTGLWGQFCR